MYFSFLFHLLVYFLRRVMMVPLSEVSFSINRADFASAFWQKWSKIRSSKFHPVWLGKNPLSCVIILDIFHVKMMGDEKVCHVDAPSFRSYCCFSNHTIFVRRTKYPSFIEGIFWSQFKDLRCQDKQRKRFEFYTKVVILRKFSSSNRIIRRLITYSGIFKKLYFCFEVI